MPSSLFGPDGTQAPPPPRLFPDPLAGLVTADTWTVSHWSGQWSRYSTSLVVAPVPVPPTPTEEIRKAVNAALDQERRRPRVQPRPAEAPRAAGQQKLEDVAGQQVADVAEQQEEKNKDSPVATALGCLLLLALLALIVWGIVSAWSAIFS